MHTLNLSPRLFRMLLHPLELARNRCILTRRSGGQEPDALGRDFPAWQRFHAKTCHRLQLDEGLDETT
jgi:hypothetical protein